MQPPTGGVIPKPQQVGVHILSNSVQHNADDLKIIVGI
jgi:hypothetical protein